ncbi:MAG: hypothetical protein LBE36_06865, partial [Flavobacteriaceae bacterium]|nr:hypothetical protein [Flavobacteriaceae bacterium]
MKKIIVLILFGLIACHKENTYISIKDDLLYMDKKNNIYLKGTINIKSENNPLSDQVRYFD